jgi:hypothetical protein
MTPLLQIVCAFLGFTFLVCLLVSILPKEKEEIVLKALREIKEFLPLTALGKAMQAYFSRKPK